MKYQQDFKYQMVQADELHLIIHQRHSSEHSSIGLVYKVHRCLYKLKQNYRPLYLPLLQRYMTL